MNTDNALKLWKKTGFVAGIAILLTVGLYLGVQGLRKPPRTEPSIPRYVGSGACRDCHKKEYDAWKGSHHALAMLAPAPKTVLGDFNNAEFTDRGKTWRFYKKQAKYFVHTDDIDGPPAEFEIAYTFGWFPLQQYIVAFPGGRFQCISVAWDVPEKRWFTLHPEQLIATTDWLHWGRPASNWNTMCSQCHSTAVRKRYNPASDTFRTTWSEISVGCEACHGPGSLHVAWARTPAVGRPKISNAALTVKTASMSQRDLIHLCAPCHSRRAELKDMDQPAADPLEAHLPVVLAEGVFYPDGQILDEDYEVHSFEQSKMYEKGVKCNDCHDVHRAKRYKEGNELCLKCHRADTYDTEMHHFHKKIVNGNPSAGALCVSCHMPGRNYMVVHFRRDHSLRIPRPDLTQSIGTPNACSQSGCHADKPLTWVLQSYDRWYGAKRKPHYGTIIAAAREGKPEASVDLAALCMDPLQPAIVRATALDLLWKYPGEESTKVLENALSDPDSLVRRIAASQMPRQDQQRFIKHLVPLLKDPVMGVRIGAAVRLMEVPQSALSEAQRASFRQGLEQYRATIAFAADMPSGRSNWANLEQNMGNVAEAEKQYRKALALDDQYYMAAVNLGMLLSQQGRNEEAEQLFRQAMRVNPQNAVIAFDLGLLLAEMGKKEDAERSLQRALELDPQMAGAAYNLAVLVGERDPGRAAALCATAAASHPEEPRYAFSRAYYQLLQGKQKEAEATLEAVLKLHPAYGDAVLMLGDLYVKLGRADDAKALYEKSLARTDLPPAYHESLSSRFNMLQPPGR